MPAAQAVGAKSRVRRKDVISSLRGRIARVPGIPNRRGMDLAKGGVQPNPTPIGVGQRVAGRGAHRLSSARPLAFVRLSLADRLPPIPKFCRGNRRRPPDSEAVGAASSSERPGWPIARFAERGLRRIFFAVGLGSAARAAGPRPEMRPRSACRRRHGPERIRLRSQTASACGQAHHGIAKLAKLVRRAALQSCFNIEPGNTEPGSTAQTRPSAG